MKANQTPKIAGGRPPRTPLKTIGMALAGVVAVVYLLNPDAGLIELIPDNIPLIGNLDEVAATILLFRVLGYFGWNPFKKKDH